MNTFDCKSLSFQVTTVFRIKKKFISKRSRKLYFLSFSILIHFNFCNLWQFLTAYTFLSFNPASIEPIALKVVVWGRRGNDFPHLFHVFVCIVSEYFIKYWFKMSLKCCWKWLVFWVGAHTSFLALHP